MIYEASTLSVAVFFCFVGLTMALSFYLARRATSSQGYFAAHGQIHWLVNGVAFAGDYLSAASFLGICGMIAFYGYDGFLYSIGYLAGWIVALFVVAEPLKRLGKFTFADALDARFQSRGIKLAVGCSTLAVSVFYLIPQMVGAGALVTPLLGFSHSAGVLLVGATVITIVVTAGMVSTTYVQFLKGSLLVAFSLVLTAMILSRGFEVRQGGADGHVFGRLGPLPAAEAEQRLLEASGEGAALAPAEGAWADLPFLRVRRDGAVQTWSVADLGDGSVELREAQTVTLTPQDQTLINGRPLGEGEGQATLHPVGYLTRLPGDRQQSGPLNPLSFFATLQESDVMLWAKYKQVVHEANGDKVTIYYQNPKPGSEVLLPGTHPRFAGVKSPRWVDKLNFLSLMLALFCGTASLPHILIRYYTVKDEASARKSTIVGIAAIGLFYVLTLYMGLGAMTSGALDVTNSNMAAPLLAKSMNAWLFAAISAIAFTTVLGTVSGLILASSGAVIYDVLSGYCGMSFSESQQVRLARFAAVFVGALAVVLGILFKKMNVSYLVGWAFSVAASANLPALIMLLFWRGTTRQGIIAAVVVGMASSLGWILLSGDTYQEVYGWDASASFIPFSQPGIVTIPLGFLTLIVVSLATAKRGG